MTTVHIVPQAQKTNGSTTQKGAQAPKVALPTTGAPTPRVEAASKAPATSPTLEAVKAKHGAPPATDAVASAQVDNAIQTAFEKQAEGASEAPRSKVNRTPAERDAFREKIRAGFAKSPKDKVGTYLEDLGVQVKRLERLGAGEKGSPLAEAVEGLRDWLKVATDEHAKLAPDWTPPAPVAGSPTARAVKVEIGEGSAVTIKEGALSPAQNAALLALVDCSAPFTVVKVLAEAGKLIVRDIAGQKALVFRKWLVAAPVSPA